MGAKGMQSPASTPSARRRAEVRTDSGERTRSAAGAEQARDSAIRLLARREHSRRELRRKLTARGHTDPEVEETLDVLATDGLQSDARFAESFARMGVDRGHGPLKIRAGLQERGIKEELIDSVIDEDEGCWHGRAQAASVKRFGVAPPADRADWGRRARFLNGRGFPSSVVWRVLGDPETLR